MITQSRGIVSDIKHYAINDGPGIRTTVFLKGCPLSCAWCHNPENVSPDRELMYVASRCIRCGECVRSCPETALRLREGKILRDRSKCTLCGGCAGLCPSLALEVVGEEMDAGAVISVIEKDRPFFEKSGGGVTFSGGEPLMQPEFLLALLKLCRQRGIHTVTDTSGQCDTGDLLKAAEFTDLFLYDIKLIDTERHRRWTGAGVELIHANLRLLCEGGARILYRLPMIGGVNCDRQNIEATAALIESMPGDNRSIDLLPWHSIAVRKYEQLNRLYPYADTFSVPTPQEISAAVMIFARHGITARAH